LRHLFYDDKIKIQISTAGVTLTNKIDKEISLSKSQSKLDPQRVVIENVKPCIDCGHFPIKRTIGEIVRVTADIFADGHEVVKGAIYCRKKDQNDWQEVAMENLGNDAFSGSFQVFEMGIYEYTVKGWIDRFQSIRQDMIKKWEAGQEISSEILELAAEIQSTSKRADNQDSKLLQSKAKELTAISEPSVGVQLAQSNELSLLMDRYKDPSRMASFPLVFEVNVERERARFGAWYEMFPRSCTTKADVHGTFRSSEQRLSDIAQMGFDVLYLPPIHPIGTTYRKGPNNALLAAPGDLGSPWAIGSKEGGHKSVHPELGTIDDFDRLVKAARKQGIEIALDLAYQCSPDHPYVREHPEWFRHRPDGTIKYAENPPKKYQDIYPVDFECKDWKGLWEELKSVAVFWIQHGVSIFRVDNPHTKSFRFWEWMIREIRKDYPETIFLSEAFTRPKVMKHLAKLGFSQSYTYFTWRNTKHELTEYFQELTQNEVREYMRPNLFANTPDILHEYLQAGKCPAFKIRLVLAATLGASYGIYGPAFELCETNAIPGTEDYVDSEKYQIRVWDLEEKQTLKEFITKVNQIRRENPALQFNFPLKFYPTDNEMMLCYIRHTPDFSNTMLIVVNLDPHYTQSGWITLPIEELNLPREKNFQVHDLLTGERYLWQGNRNFVQLNPVISPAHIFRVRRKIKTEHDFDYYL
jgi:starch synthase (maltosyl-transferring)